MSKQEYYEKAERLALEHAKRQMADPRPYSQRLEPVLTNEERKMHRAKLDETRQLKGRFRDYCTDIDVSSPCEVLPPDYQAYLDSSCKKYVQKGGIDVAEFRTWCYNLDRDEAWIAKTEERLF